MAGTPVYRTKDRCAGLRCPNCDRKGAKKTANELSTRDLLMLDYMRSLLVNSGDDGFMNTKDATKDTENKHYGSLQSRETGKKYRAPVKLARTSVRVLEAFGLVDYLPLTKNESGHRINDHGIDFLERRIAVPKTSWTLDGGCLRQSTHARVTIVDLGFAPEPNTPVYLYP
jgi:hypothetical protein